MPTGSELNDQIGHAVEVLRRDHTLAPIAREAIKDVRSTLMEVFFGKGERGAEPGTPLNPLFHDIVAARKTHAEKGPTMDASLPTPSQVIDNPQAYLPQQDGQGNGNAMAMEAAAPGMDATPSPSQVIDNPQAYMPEPSQQGQEQQHGHEM